MKEIKERNIERIRIRGGGGVNERKRMVAMEARRKTKIAQDLNESEPDRHASQRPQVQLEIRLTYGQRRWSGEGWDASPKLPCRGAYERRDWRTGHGSASRNFRSREKRIVDVGIAEQIGSMGKRESDPQERGEIVVLEASGETKIAPERNESKPDAAIEKARQSRPRLRVSPERLPPVIRSRPQPVGGKKSKSQNTHPHPCSSYLLDDRFQSPPPPPPPPESESEGAAAEVHPEECVMVGVGIHIGVNRGGCGGSERERKKPQNAKHKAKRTKNTKRDYVARERREEAELVVEEGRSLWWRLWGYRIRIHLSYNKVPLAEEGAGPADVHARGAGGDACVRVSERHKQEETHPSAPSRTRAARNQGFPSVVSSIGRAALLLVASFFFVDFDFFSSALAPFYCVASVPETVAPSEFGVDEAEEAEGPVGGTESKPETEASRLSSPGRDESSRCGDPGNLSERENVVVLVV
ncbi:hypothetical protein B0H11DRAFT_2191157 [Mycena galericulata]|nr:hypothetical protein B0H11DRAFT_2191157 [Mycena galericulata]